MNRADLQRLSNTRIREATILFKAGEHSGAYYLAGYSVECALKACFARNIKRYDFPDRDGASKVFTHKLKELVKLAQLNTELARAENTNTQFKSGWDLVCQWTEESRYALWTKAEAEDILNAITKRRDGVLPWIKRHW